MTAIETLTANVMTVAQQRQVVAELDALLAATFETDSDKTLKKVLAEKLRLGTKDVIEEILVVEKVGGDWQKLKNLLESLKANILSLPVAKLTLAFEPDLAFASEIATKLREKFSAPLLLDLAFDPQILGGVALVYDGRIYDLTLASKLAHWQKQQA